VLFIKSNTPQQFTALNQHIMHQYYCNTRIIHAAMLSFVLARFCIKTFLGHNVARQCMTTGPRVSHLQHSPTQCARQCMTLEAFPFTPPLAHPVTVNDRGTPTSRRFGFYFMIERMRCLDVPWVTWTVSQSNQSAS